MVDTHGVRTVAVTGRYIKGLLDGPDAGVEPNVEPLQYLPIRLTPTPRINELHGDTPPTTMILEPFDLETGEDGNVRNPDTGDTAIRIPVEYMGAEGLQRIKWKSEVRTKPGSKAVITKEWVVPLDATSVDLTIVEPLPGSYVINLDGWEQLNENIREAKESTLLAASEAAASKLAAQQHEQAAADARDVAVAKVGVFEAPTKGVLDDIMGGDVAGLAPTVAGKVTKGQITMHVADYGAKGDGVTDDTASLVSALAAARAAKASLRFGYGKTYIVSGLLNPTGVALDGYAATIKTKPGITQNFALLQPSGVWSAKDLTFDMNKANTTDPGSAATGMAIYTYSATGWEGTVRIENIRIINGWQTGIRIGTASAATDPTNIVNSKTEISGLVVDSCKVGVYLQNTNGVVIVNPAISATGSDGISDYFSYGTQVLGGRVTNAGGHGVVTQYSYGFQVSGTNVSNAGNMGIVVGGGSNTLNHAQNFRIVGCSITGSVSNGVSVDPTKTGEASVVQAVYGAITGNVSNRNGMHGIYLHNAQSITVTGNVSVGNLAAAAGGIAMDSYSCTIAGNLLSGNSYGIKFQGEASSYGSHSVSGNTVINNATSNYAYSTYGAANTAMALHGVGVPALGAPVGSTYTRTDGSTGATLYVKESGGVTSFGWVAK